MTKAEHKALHQMLKASPIKEISQNHRGDLIILLENKQLARVYHDPVKPRKLGLNLNRV